MSWNMLRFFIEIIRPLAVKPAKSQSYKEPTAANTII